MLWGTDYTVSSNNGTRHHWNIAYLCFVLNYVKCSELKLQTVIKHSNNNKLTAFLIKQSYKKKYAVKNVCRQIFCVFMFWNIYFVFCFISILKSSVLPTELSCPLSCPLYPYMEVVGSLICMAKFPWAAHFTHCPLSCPLFSYLVAMGCLLSCPLFPYMEVVGSPICMAKFLWAAHGQPTPLPTELPTFFIFGIGGLPTELPTELPTISVYGSSGEPNLHGKILTGSPLRCPLSCPLFSYLEAVDCLLSYPLFPYMEEAGT